MCICGGYRLAKVSHSYNCNSEVLSDHSLVTTIWVCIKFYIVHHMFTGNLCLNYLANQPNELYVTQNLTRLLVKVVKLGWFETINDEFIFRKTIDDVQLFLEVRHSSHFIMTAKLCWIFYQPPTPYILISAIGKFTHTYTHTLANSLRKTWTEKCHEYNFRSPQQ